MKIPRKELERIIGVIDRNIAKIKRECGRSLNPEVQRINVLREIDLSWCRTAIQGQMIRADAHKKQRKAA